MLFNIGVVMEIITLVCGLIAGIFLGEQVLPKQRVVTWIRTVIQNAVKVEVQQNFGPPRTTDELAEQLALRKARNSKLIQRNEQKWGDLVKSGTLSKTQQIILETDNVTEN